MNTKHLFYKILFLLFIGYSISLYYSLRTNQLSNENLNESNYNESFPKEAQVEPMPKAIKCEMERINVVEIGDISDVKGSNYLKAFPLKLINLKKQQMLAYYVSENETPIDKNAFLVATNCHDLTETELDSYRDKTKDSCIGFYYWNKKTYQIRRECGFFLDESVLFMSFN